MRHMRSGVGLSAAASALAVLLWAGSAHANPIYLNFANISVALGPTMSAEPFANQTTAVSLKNTIDAPSAAASENHISPTTHVWVNGGPLELLFDFRTEYDLRQLHFWNYHTEDFDVDNIAFTFFDASKVNVGSLNASPALGGSGGNPIFAENFALAFPSNVQFVNAMLTGSNNQVDFNNIGFTAELSPVPEPASLLLLGTGVLAGVVRRRFRKP